MNLYTSIKNLWKKPEDNMKSLLQERLIAWRNGKVITRIERPTRLDRARTLGYKAKRGYIVVRIKLRRSKRQRPLIKKGRRSKHRRRKKVVNKSYRWIAEERANKKFPNCEVIGSYPVGEDGQHKFFEIVLADREIVGNYKKMNWLNNARGRT